MSLIKVHKSKSREAGWFRVIRAFLAMITFAFFFFLISTAPQFMWMFPRLFWLVAANIVAALLELFGVVGDPVVSILFYGIF